MVNRPAKQKPVGKADRRPHDRVDDQHQKQRAGRGDRRQRRERADMADRPHDPGDGDAAEQETDEIGRADEADRAGEKPSWAPRSAISVPCMPIAAEQNAGSDEQRDQRTDRGHRQDTVCGIAGL